MAALPLSHFQTRRELTYFSSNCRSGHKISLAVHAHNASPTSRVHRASRDNSSTQTRVVSTPIPLSPISRRLHQLALSSILISSCEPQIPLLFFMYIFVVVFVAGLHRMPGTVCGRRNSRSSTVWPSLSRGETCPYCVLTEPVKLIHCLAPGSQLTIHDGSRFVQRGPRFAQRTY